MKKLFAVIAVVAASLTMPMLYVGATASVVAAQGCAATATNKWAQARVTLTSAQDSVLLAHSAGLLTDEDLVRADALVQSARVALDQAETYLPDGGTSFEQRLAIIDRIIDQLTLMAAAGDLD